MHETAYLNPNLTIIFINKRVGEEEEVTFHEENGIKAFISDMNKEKEKVTDIIYFKKEQDGIEVEVAFQYINDFTENISGFCNNIYTQEGGTHITGFKSVLTSTNLISMQENLEFLKIRILILQERMCEME